jgi:Carboxypeptidase regulatory-like domain
VKKPRWTARTGRRPIALAALVVGAVVVALSVGLTPAAASTASPGGSTAKSTPSSTVTKAAAPTTSGSRTGAIGTVTVGHSIKNDVSAPLRSVAKPATAQSAAKSLPVLPLPTHQQAAPSRADTAVQSQLASPKMPATQLNFEGVDYPGVDCFCAPPDTNGEVGDTQYVQIVNMGLEVFDKSNGNSLLGPVAITSLWSGFGGACETSGEGDPVTLYDQIAKRWVVTQFAQFPPTIECVAVSTTDDATGTWNRYAFDIGSQFGVNFYDYPKLSVWPDAYYMSFNVFDASGSSFLGPQPFALDRSAMLAGQPATVVSTGKLTPNDDQLMPADLDGSNMPPAGAPNPFTEIGTNSTWKIWRFHVDFANPGNSTFTLAGTLTPDPFQVICGGSAGACVPQAGVPDVLDTLGDRSMFRSAYRHFADGHEALVGNMTVQSNGVAGIRWWEINNVTSGTPSFVQQSTYQPDDTWRWMGSAAMDASGDLAVGFSASSSTINPQIRYAGRLAGDPANTLAQGEAHLFDGTGSQEFVVRGRWGDYSGLTVDPSDDCTFWYTNEYYQTTSSFNWRTRIGNFKFPNCTAGPSGTLTGTVTDASTHNPITGADVATQFGSTVTDSTGHYSITLPVGSYSVNYSRFGYATDTENVAISDGTATTENVALQPSPAVTVSGTITDGSGHGWPLYIRISVDGDPDGPFFTDPITGKYTIQLPANATYSVTFQSQLAGYQAVSQSVAVGGSNTIQDVAVPVTPNCTAPGYTTGSPCVVVPGGLVEGNVFDLNTGAAINGATVTSVDKPTEKTTTFATPDDPNNPDGFYWLFSSLTGSHAFTASVAKHSDDTQTVNVTADSVARQDYKLGAGHLTISASAITSTQVLGTTATQTLAFHNDGTGPAHVQVTGCCGSFQLASPSTTAGHFTWIAAPPDDGVDMTGNAAGFDEAFPSEGRWTSASASATDPAILIYSDDPYHPSPNTYVDQALKRLGLSYTAFYDGNFAGFENALTSGTWDAVVFADDNFIPPSSTLTALNNYVVGGGKLVVDSWTVSTNPSPLWATVGFQLSSVDTDPPDPVHWWEPDHPVFNHPESVPEFTQLQSGRYFTDGQRGDPLGGFEALAGSTMAPAAGQAALILGNNDHTIFKGFMDGTNDADLNGDGVKDDVQLWENMVSGVVQGFSVPWLAQSPAQFDVPVGATVSTTVTLSATTADGVTQPGTDSAQILVSTNTPQTFNPIGVTMNVTPPNGWGKLAGTLSGTDCSGKTNPLKGVVFATGKGYSFTLKTDAKGSYAFWAPSSGNPITLTASASGWIAQNQKVNIRIGKTTSVNFTLRPVTC